MITWNYWKSIFAIGPSQSLYATGSTLQQKYAKRYSGNSVQMLHLQ